IDAHLHTFEESIFILEGQLICQTGDGTYSLEPGDYGVIQVSAPHALRNDGSVRVRWAEMFAPQLRRDGECEVYPVDELPKTEPISIDARDPRTRSFGHISPENMNPGKQTQ